MRLLTDIRMALLWLHMYMAWAMYCKRQLADNLAALPADKRFRADVADLFLSNDIPAARARRLYQHASMAGAKHVDNLAHCAGSTKNICRNLTRKLLKKAGWPKPYYAKLPCRSPKTQALEYMWVPLWLPHELVGCVFSHNETNSMLSQMGLGSHNKSHLEAVARQLDVRSDSLLALGIWCDGVPFNSDRTKSLEVVSMSFPGHDTDLRLPLMALPKTFMLPDQTTYDAVMSIFAWSFQRLLLGRFPSKRHNGAAWLPSWDSDRRKQAGQPLQQAVLTEVRGDWACYKAMFRLPGWQEKRGCCFRCNITPDKIKECHSGAAWRQDENRLSHGQVLQRILEKGDIISPIFSAPYLVTACFRIDWLHVADLGVTADFLGSLFTLCLPCFPGRSKAEQCKQLHLRMQTFYKTCVCTSRLDELKPTMLKKRGATKYPKLRAKAGEARALVPFAKLLAAEVLGNSPEHETAKHCATALNDTYECLSAANFSEARIAETARIFALHYIALSTLATALGACRWGVKPKFHLFLEMTTCKSSPAKCWTYRDEDFGGTVANMCTRRGGKNSPVSVGRTLFAKFAAMHNPPVF
jgi:hypothetical protein